MFFYKKWSPKLKFLNDFFFEKISLIFDMENWLWNYNFGTFWWTMIHHRIILKEFSLSVLILGQKSCIFGPTIFKIPQPNWHFSPYYRGSIKSETPLHQLGQPLPDNKMFTLKKSLMSFFCLDIIGTWKNLFLSCLKSKAKHCNLLSLFWTKRIVSPTSNYISHIKYHWQSAQRNCNGYVNNRK